jgi:branched-chain amino acid transport system permease protein
LAIKAVIDNRIAATVVGVDVARIQRMALALGFAIAALAGALLGMVEQIGPFMGFPYTIAAFVVIILGGLGRLGGGIVAGLLLGFVQVYGVALTAPTFSSMLLYGTFVAVLLLRPQGLARVARGRS